MNAVPVLTAGVSCNSEDWDFAELVWRLADELDLQSMSGMMEFCSRLRDAGYRVWRVNG